MTGTEKVKSGTIDMKLEAVVIPVSDVGRSKNFYAGLGWRLDADFVVGDTFRVVQFTPPGSPCSIHFGTGLTSAAPGSVLRPRPSRSSVFSAPSSQRLRWRRFCISLSAWAGTRRSW